MTGNGYSFMDSVRAPGVAGRGLMLVLSSPSGAGKSSIATALVGNHPDIALSVSVTTRPPRPGEVEGKHYYFVDEARFAEMVGKGELLEHARVHRNLYGTPGAPVQAALAAGRDVLFDVDWQGTQRLAMSARPDLVSVFILPPSMEELERRLRARAQDSEEVVRLRLDNAVEEMSHYPEYDYAIVNTSLNDSVRTVEAILAVERLKRHRQIGLADFVGRMRGQD